MKNLLTALLLLIPFVVLGQTKIGNLTIDNETAQRYFSDCYNHPDTIKEKDAYEIMGINSPGMHTLPMNYKDIENDCKDYNYSLSKQSVGKAIKIVHHASGFDTVRKDGILFATGLDFKKDKKIHPLAYKVEPFEAYDETIFLGWLIPRNPTEIDFIKWVAKNKLSN